MAFLRTYIGNLDMLVLHQRPEALDIFGDEARQVPVRDLQAEVACFGLAEFQNLLNEPGQTVDV